jgi:diguanylate cyclase (GGDEF)-like protein
MQDHTPSIPGAVMTLPATAVRLRWVGDRLLGSLSLYLIPLAAAVLAVWALLAWEPAYEFGGVDPIEFRVLRDDSGILSQSQVSGALDSMTWASDLQTRLSEAPFWVAFQAGAAISGTAPAILFPSRHARRVECWSQGTGERLGIADRDRSSGQVRQALGGFRLDGAAGPVLCRVESAGPGRLTVQRWEAAGLDHAQRKFERNSGLIDGSVAILALFALMVAFVYRDALIVLFAAWLLANMRMAALSAGWDGHILEQAIPADWLGTVRSLTIAVFYTLTTAVFLRMFRSELKQVGTPFSLGFAQWSPVPLLAAALLLPYQTFLQIVWVTALVGIALLCGQIYRVIRYTNSRIAMWYAGAHAVLLGIILSSNVYEIAAAALGITTAAGTVNSVTAAVFSSLMVAVAIAEHMNREQRGRREAQAELQHTYDVIPVGLFTLDGDGRFQKTNPALLAMIDRPGDAGCASWGDCFADGCWESLQQALSKSDTVDIEVSGKPHADGSASRFLVKAAIAQGRIEGSLQDITERHEADRKLRHLAEFDALTKVLNRRGIEAVAAAALERCSPQRPLALAYLDMDRFKLINDLFGHTVGDDVLKQICERVAGAIGHHRLGRVGGDEFLVVMENTTVAQAGLICQTIVELVGGRSFESGGKGFSVGVSVGLVELVAPTSLKDAVSTADRACRLAKTKESGVHVFEAGSQALRDYARELGLIGRFGVDRPPEGLFLEMQPILSLRAPTESLNFEMLLRMRDTDGSIVPAGQIISAAENSGRITLIDRWVLGATLAWLERNKERLGKTRFVSMNLSGASLSDEVFVREAFEMLSKAPAARDRLCLEVTESVALRDTGSTRTFLENARRLGIRVALDDFGAGYTSFSYLRELPADALKIDGSFVRDAASHPASLSIIEAMAKLASNFGMQTIAEWAEDLPTLEALALAGIDHVQGWVVSRPVGEDALLRADSAVDLIQDPKVAAFVRNLGAMPQQGCPVSVAHDHRTWTVH